MVGFCIDATNFKVKQWEVGFKIKSIEVYLHIDINFRIFYPKARIEYYFISHLFKKYYLR